MSTQERPTCALRERKTKFVEIFRTTPAQTICPNFFVLSHANGCAFTPTCEYCYLKSTFWYLDQPQAFTNLDQMEQEVRAWIARDELESYVLNTGNLSDSLSFEAVRPGLTRMVELFREHAKGRPHILLLVTKGGMKECQWLLEARPCENVVISFSINSPEAAALYERGAATPADRLAAATALRKAGWRIRLRLDPMILGFSYREVTVQMLAVGPERVTLGALRAEPHLLTVEHTDLFKKLAPAPGPKALARYPRPERMELYRQAVEILRPACEIGLCEETLDVWQELGLDHKNRTCNCGS